MSPVVVTSDVELGVSTLYCCTHGPTTLLGTVQGIRSMSEGNGGLLAVQMLQEDDAILGLEKVNSFLQQEPTTFHLFNH